jgi:hypothetical protein
VTVLSFRPQKAGDEKSLFALMYFYFLDFFEIEMCIVSCLSGIYFLDPVVFG